MQRYKRPWQPPRWPSATGSSTPSPTAAGRRNSSSWCGARRRSGRRWSVAPAPRWTDRLFQLHDVEPDLALADVLGGVRRARFVDSHVSALVDDLFLLAV